MKTKDEIKQMSLGSLLQKAISSYNWISQDPDKRGMSVVHDYSLEMDADLEHFKGMGANQESLDRYKEGYISKISTWLNSQSNCASSFVCGPAKFPVAKMEKRNRWADNHYQAFRTWRDKVYAGYAKRAKKDAIIAGGGELEIARKKLEALEGLQTKMKFINKVHKEFLKNEKAVLNYPELTEKEIKLITTYVPAYSWEKHPYAPYMLTNNNATIKNTKERIATLEAKEDAATEGVKEIPFEGGKVILNVEIDRLQVQHDAIPAPEVRANLKKNGFNWSPFHKVWQRKLTDNAKYATAKLFNIQIA